MVPQAEHEKRSKVVRILRITEPLIEEVRLFLQATRGGDWPQGQAIHHALREWLAIQRGEVRP